MASNYKQFYVQLFNTRTGLAIDDDSGLYCVMQAGVPLKQTAYSDDNGTSLTQPATMTNGVIRFFVDSATTSVDLSICSSTGRAYFIEGLTESQHRRDVDPDLLDYTLVGSWAILSAHGDGVVSAVFAPQSGGLPAGLKIKDVYVHKTSAGVGVGAGLLLDFGVSGDSDGFVDGMTCTATGYYMNGPVLLTNTDVAAGKIVALAQTRGLLLQEAGVGVDTATTAGIKGFFTRKPYMISLVTTTNNLVFAITATSALTTVAGSRGYVFYEYSIIPTAGN